MDPNYLLGVIDARATMGRYGSTGRGKPKRLNIGIKGLTFEVAEALAATYGGSADDHGAYSRWHCRGDAAETLLDQIGDRLVLQRDRVAMLRGAAPA